MKPTLLEILALADAMPPLHVLAELSAHNSISTHEIYAIQKNGDHICTACGIIGKELDNTICKGDN